MDEQPTQIADGFVPMVKAEGDVSLRDAGALAVVAGGNASLSEAGAGVFVAGGDVTMRQAGAGNMLVGGSAEMSDAAVGSMLVGEASLDGSRVGVLVTARANLTDSTVILGTPQAVGLGVAAGVTLFVLGRLLRRG